MSTFSKPGTKYQPPDWFTNSFALSTNSERQRDASHQIRQETRSLRLASSLRSKWDEFNNTTRLNDRIDAITEFKDILNLAHEHLDKELSMINLGKCALEEQMLHLRIPLYCASKCLTLRDQRKGIDFVEDAPEMQLNKENEIIIQCFRQLQQKVDEAFEQMILLKEAKKQVILDLKNKQEALNIDNEQYKLTPDCPGVSFKPNSTRIPKATTTIQEWEDFSRYNWQRAQAEIGSSQRLREAIYQTLCKVANDLEAQDQATTFALRRRKQEINQALDELDWQKKQIEEEINEMENDLAQLELTMEKMIPVGKLVQTRLERRTYRSGVDLCRDSAQYGLTDEVRQIEVTCEALLEQQRQARHSLDALNKQLNRINDDIALKEKSLKLEENCLNSRYSLLHSDVLKDEGNVNNNYFKESDKIHKLL